MSHRIGRQRIVASRSLLLEGAAERRDELIEAIAARLDAAEVHDSRWSVRDVALELWSPPVPWLAVQHRRLPDVRQYVRCRPFGAHLEVMHICTVEPVWWKYALASFVKAGAWWAWSLPEGGELELELRSWLAVVGHAVTAATKQLAQDLARGRVLGQPEHDPLAWW
ncbi:MAG: hypothetical protein ABI193_24010 [Minicystis sp.]